MNIPLSFIEEYKDWLSTPVWILYKRSDDTLINVYLDEVKATAACDASSYMVTEWVRLRPAPQHRRDGVLGDRTPMGVTYTQLQPTTGDPFAPDAKWVKPVPRTVQVEGGVMGDWAVVVEDVYPMHKGGWNHWGTILYGKPMHGDQVAPYGTKPLVCTGVERYSISAWWGAGGKAGICLPEGYPAGTVLLGQHTDQSKDYS